jgi:hypothetical protein
MPESDEIEQIVPLALLFHIVYIIVNDLEYVFLELIELELPLLLHYAPNILLLPASTLHHLNLVVQLLNRRERQGTRLPPAQLTVTLIVQFYLHALTATGRLDLRDEVQGQQLSLLDPAKRRHQPVSIDVHCGTVGGTSMLEVEHLPPYPVSI